MAFCEGKYGGLFRGVEQGVEEKGKYYPEWGNSISALFISYIGFHVASFWDHDSMMLRLIASLFFVNGWSSCAYHAMGVLGFVDANSMILCTWLTSGFMLEELVDVVFRRTDWGIRCGWILKLRGLSWLATMSVAWWQMGGAPWGDKEYQKELFEIMFGLPIGLIIILAYGVSKYGGNWVANEFVTVEMANACRIRMNWGLAVATTAAILWFLTEKLCEQVVFFRWFPGHLVWHIFMSWGLLQVLHFCALLRADNFQAYPGPVVTEPPFKKFKDWYFFIFPSLVFYADPETCSASQRRLLSAAHSHKQRNHLAMPSFYTNGGGFFGHKKVEPASEPHTQHTELEEFSPPRSPYSDRPTAPQVFGAPKK